MNEEEKQAIDWLKEELDDEKKSSKNCNYSYKGVTGLYGNNEVEIALKLIEKQQKEIEDLKGKNKELFEEYNKRVSTIIDYEQGLKEIIDEEDDPDTWAYHAVKKLLEEVGGIEYE